MIYKLALFACLFIAQHYCVWSEFGLVLINLWSSKQKSQRLRLYTVAKKIWAGSYDRSPNEFCFAQTKSNSFERDVPDLGGINILIKKKSTKKTTEFEKKNVILGKKKKSFCPG